MMFLWPNHSDDEGEPDDEEDDDDHENSDDDGDDDASDECNEDDEDGVNENGIIEEDSPEKPQSPVRWCNTHVIYIFIYLYIYQTTCFKLLFFCCCIWSAVCMLVSKQINFF